MEDFKKVYNLFFNPGEVTEIRAYGLKRSNPGWEGWAGGAGIVFGYFNNPDDFAKAAAALDQAKAPGIYFTLNPVNPDLLARAVNRLKAADMKSSATSDADIKCIRWLLIDLDPRRPAGISSTDEEIADAKVVREKIIAFFSGKPFSFPLPVRAFSGNGVHAMYRLPDISIENDYVKKWLEYLDGKFSTRRVQVDTKVFNPARIWKLYGTTARKGDHTKERPHRKSYLEE